MQVIMSNQFRRTCFSFAVGLACTQLFFAENTSSQSKFDLLPKVKEMTTMEGSLDICAATITLIGRQQTREDDLFAASILARGVQEYCGKEVKVEDRVPAANIKGPLLVLDDKGEEASLPGATEVAGKNSRESYDLSISHNRATITAHSAAGVFYGTQTLLQILKEASPKNSLPNLHITDWPAMPYRGFMLDTSHGAMPTLETTKHLIDDLARWKANQFYLYFETNIELNALPAGDPSTRWSQTEIQELIRYAAQRHVDLIPCFELYGHLHELLQREGYRELGALPHGGELNPASPEALRLASAILTEVAHLFPSPWIHIGFDEPFELEHMPASASGGRTPDALWAGHLQAMAKLAQSLGKRPMFWADIDEGAYIFNKYPRLASQLPSNAVAVPWFYDPKNDYRPLLNPFSQNHVPLLVAPAITDWDDISPDYKTTFLNINGMVQAGREVQAMGMINTVWSDSELPLHRAGEPGIAFGAASAWEPSAIPTENFFERYTNLSFPSDAHAQAAEAIKALAEAQVLLKGALGSETAFRLWDNPFAPERIALAQKHLNDLQQARFAAEKAEPLLLQLCKLNPQEQAYATLLTLAHIVDYAALRSIYAVEITENLNHLAEKPSVEEIQFYLGREMAARNHSRVQDLIDLSGSLAEEYKTSWLSEYRPYRLSTALGRWTREQQFWIQLQAKTWEFEHRFRSGDPRPNIQALLP